MKKKSDSELDPELDPEFGSGSRSISQRYGSGDPDPDFFGDPDPLVRGCHGSPALLKSLDDPCLTRFSSSGVGCLSCLVYTFCNQTELMSGCRSRIHETYNFVEASGHNLKSSQT
jgi:hypothetical protein